MAAGASAAKVLLCNQAGTATDKTAMQHHVYTDSVCSISLEAGGVQLALVENSVGLFDPVLTVHVQHTQR